jgi:hypothetical protein
MGEGGGTLHQVCVLRYRLRDISNLAHAVIAGLYYALTPGEIVLVVRLLPLPPPPHPFRTHTLVRATQGSSRSDGASRAGQGYLLGLAHRQAGDWVHAAIYVVPGQLWRPTQANGQAGPRYVAAAHVVASHATWMQIGFA